MKHLTTVLALGYLILGAPASRAADIPQWRDLFNGKDLEGWEHKGNWAVADGAITRQGKGGSLTFKQRKVPDDFELRFEWKVAKGSNSGVYYRPGQYEYQILDNKVHGDGKNPRTSAASLYFCMAPAKDATRPVGEWNTFHITVIGDEATIEGYIDTFVGNLYPALVP